MMRGVIFLIAWGMLGADDPWTKVRDLKSGTEVRIFKKGGKQPLTGKIDEANAERIVVVLKNEQTAIAKEEIDRLDYRPSGSRVKPTSQTKVEDPKADKPPVGPPGMARPGMSSSAGMSVGSKPDFETIYRRPAK
jgi:hypothetical protein